MRAALVLGALVWANTAHAQDIASARYTDPTTRYPHGVLGDDIEYATLDVTLTNGERRRATWPPGMVFEDLAPRISDVTGDGKPEIITVESSDQAGARLAIWAIDSAGKLTALAQTPHIGTRNRWLAPIGAADLDGDGAIEIAYIDRPHLAKTLRIWRFKDGQLTQVATAKGLTNHRIGEDFISSGIRTCVGRVEMIMADAQWQRIIAVTLSQNTVTRRDLGPFSAQALSKALTCS